MPRALKWGITMRKGVIYVVLVLFIILMSLFPVFTDYSTRHYRETRGVEKAIERAQEYLYNKYPGYDITVKDVECKKSDNGKFYYKGYAMDGAGFEYIFALNMDYELESIYISDNNMKMHMKKTIETAIDHNKLAIDKYDVEITAFPVSGKEDIRYRLYVRIDMKGRKISRKELAEIAFPMRNHIIADTQDKYNLNNLAIKYTCNDGGQEEDMLLNLSGRVQDYNINKMEKMVRSQ